MAMKKTTTDRCVATRRPRREAACREHMLDRVELVELGEVLVITRRPRCAVIAVTVVGLWGTA